ncbi:MAG: hypothetical protein KF762_18450 [Acidobacteria bacterium]|nr:hypothetical protein [Acidobacteriota bacterium]
MIRTATVAFIFALLFGYSCLFTQDAGESICLIPEGYEGPVFIIFGQKNGHPPKIEDGRRVYVIPDDGVLKTTAEVNFRIDNNKFYYVSPDGKRRRIEYLFPGGKAWVDKPYTEDKIDISKDEVYVFSDLMGGVTNTMGKEVRFRQFLVGKPKEKLQLHMESERKISLLTGALDDFE